jgi:hypothetical protein
MREKGKQEGDEGSSGSAEGIPTEASIRGPALIYDDESFARRAGEIIATAVRAVGRGLRRRSN